MAGKAGPEVADKIKIAGANLRAFAKHLARFGVYHIQPTACGDITQATLGQCALHLWPALRADQGFGDDQAKAGKVGFINSCLLPHLTAGMALHLKPDKVAQHRAGGFITVLAGFKEPLPKLGVTRERSGLHHHAP